MSLDISSPSPTQLVLKMATDNQEKLQKVSIQIASGNKNENFKDFAKDATTENFLSFKASLGDIETHIRANDSSIARAKTADAAINEMQGLASDLAALIAQKRNGATGSEVNLNLEVGGILSKLEGKLNIKFDGRFLFAGSKTNTRPINDITVSNIDNSGPVPVATGDYYMGDEEKPTARSSDSEEVEYGILGNNTAFKSLIGAAHLAISGETNDSDITLQNALSMVDTAINELASTRATGLIAIDRMQKSNASHTNAKLLVEGNLNKISQTDIVEATAIMSQLQAIVQAGYLAFSRLSSLRLTDYLR